LRVYPGQNCRGELYADDGDTMEYTHGAFFRQRFTCTGTKDAGVAALTMSAPSGPYSPWWKSVQVTLYGSPRAASKVTVNSQAVPDAKFDAQSHAVTFTVPALRQATEIKVEY
jgi:alpha-glucosidase